MRAALPAAILALLAGCAPAGGTTWHVDYAEGSDTADGRTPRTAWRHAPGDTRATAGPAGVHLQPGDQVLFRAGVPYRGTIRLNASGRPDQPITFTGLGWGEGMGVIDGADPVTLARPCASAADCGGAADWKALTRVEFARPETARVVLYGAKGLYWPSQIPELPDPFYSDERQDFAPVPLAQLDALRRGELVSPALAQAAKSGGQMELAFWARPNLVFRRPLKAVVGDRLLFDAQGLDFYTDRDGAVALGGSFEGLKQPGRFVTLAPGVLVVRLRPEDSAATLSVGNGRMGLDLNGQSGIRITGLHFRNMTAAAERKQEGIAIADLDGRPSGIEISGNRFGPALIESRNGIVRLLGARDTRFLANRIEDIAYGSGLIAGGNRPGNLLVAGNVVHRVGHVGIWVMGVDGAVVKGNVLADIRGVHGNALSAYLDNHDILFEGNCVVGSTRPLTFHGDRSGAVPNHIVIRNNILITSADGQAAIASWGAKTRDVLIENNLLLGPRQGLLLSDSDTGVVVRGNDTSGIAVDGTPGADWKMADNRTSLTFADTRGGSFGASGCAVPGTRIAPVVRWQGGD